MFLSLPRQHIAITPSNTVNLKTLMQVYATGSGNVAVVDEFDTVIVYPVVAGQTIPILVKRVNSTSTTATGLVGVYDWC